MVLVKAELPGRLKPVKPRGQALGRSSPGYWTTSTGNSDPPDPPALSWVGFPRANYKQYQWPDRVDILFTLPVNEKKIYGVAALKDNRLFNPHQFGLSLSSVVYCVEGAVSFL